MLKDKLPVLNAVSSLPSPTPIPSFEPPRADLRVKMTVTERD